MMDSALHSLPGSSSPLVYREGGEKSAQFRAGARPLPALGRKKTQAGRSAPWGVASTLPADALPAQRSKAGKPLKCGAHRAVAIQVTELSRWGRSTQDLVQTLDDLHGWKVSVLAQTGLSFDLSTASGKLMRTSAGLAEFERDLMRDRVKSGLAAARARGVKLGHQVGQRPSDKKAKRVLGMHADGLSYRFTARNVRMSKNTVVMRARQLLDGASFGPDALRVIDVAFDAAWVEIAGNFSNDLTETEAARLMRADALLCCQRRPAATWEVLKRAYTPTNGVRLPIQINLCSAKCTRLGHKSKRGEKRRRGAGEAGRA